MHVSNSVTKSRSSGRFAAIRMTAGPLRGHQDDIPGPLRGHQDDILRRPLRGIRMTSASRSAREARNVGRATIQLSASVCRRITAPAFLAETLASIAAQTFEDYEVLIVDDGSKDSTVDIAEAYAASDARVRVVRNSERAGSSARNANQCVKLARGEWLKFLYQDDVMTPSCLEQMLDAGRHGPFVITWHGYLFEPNVDEPTRRILRKPSDTCIGDSRHVRDNRSILRRDVDALEHQLHRANEQQPHSPGLLRSTRRVQPLHRDLSRSRVLDYVLVATKGLPSRPNGSSCFASTERRSAPACAIATIHDDTRIHSSRSRWSVSLLARPSTRRFEIARGRITA